MAKTPDFYQTITDRLIEMVEAGPAKWHKSWTALIGQKLPLRVTGERYSGVNAIQLWFAAADKGYDQPTWMTFKQAQALGATVRGGEKGTQVIFTSAFVKTQDDGSDRRVPFIKTYTVFNVQQIDGLPEKYFVQPAAPRVVGERSDEADAFFEATRISFNHGGDRAFYDPMLDYVQLPAFEAFDTPDAYYSVKAHEAVHWTGHSSRLARIEPTLFGSQNYAKEELVAEIGAAFTMAYLGLAAEPRADHASYLASWLQHLKDDPKMLMKAASAAEKALGLLINKGAAAVAPEPQEGAEGAPMEQAA